MRIPGAGRTTVGRPRRGLDLPSSGNTWGPVTRDEDGTSGRNRENDREYQPSLGCSRPPGDGERPGSSSGEGERKKGKIFLEDLEEGRLVVTGKQRWCPSGQRGVLNNPHHPPTFSSLSLGVQVGERSVCSGDPGSLHVVEGTPET